MQTTKKITLAAVLLALLVTLSGLDAAARARRGTVTREGPPTVASTDVMLERAGLHFEANLGQTDASVRFIARALGYHAFVRSRDVVFSLRGAGASEGLRMEFAGASPTPIVQAQEPRRGRSNYFLGNDAAKWVTGVPHFGRVVVRDLYPGVDVHWRGADGRLLRYDVVVTPGADPTDIALRFEGAQSLRVGDGGELVVETPNGELRHSRPRIYQETTEGRRAVSGGFVARPDGTAGFALGRYDRNLELVIDPDVEYATLLGESEPEYGIGIAVNDAGEVFLSGITTSNDFLNVSAAQGSYAGNQDLFVTKFSADGSEVLYSTFLGGGGKDNGGALALDSTGAVYVVGETGSDDLPVVPQQNPLQGNRAGGGDFFVAKLDPTGSALVYSTYLGGSENEYAGTIDVDSAGVAHVGGSTESTDFPMVDPFQERSNGDNDAFYAQIDATGTSLLYSTYLGGNAEDGLKALRVLPDGTVCMCGETESDDFPVASAFQADSGGDTDGWITKLDPVKNTLVFSTYFGSSSGDQCRALECDADGFIYVAGSTASDDFPLRFPLQGTRGGGGDTFVSKLLPDGSEIVYSTFVGGREHEEANGLAVDGKGAVYVVGFTRSVDFPVEDPIQAEPPDPADVALPFVFKLNPAGSAFVYSTFFGSAGDDEIGTDVVVDAVGRAYVTGWVIGSDLPLSENAFQSRAAGGEEAFYARFSAQEGNVPPPDTIKSFLLPKKVRVTVGPGKREPVVKAAGFFDLGPDDVSLTDALTITIGSVQKDIGGLAPAADGKKFTFADDELVLVVTVPNPLSSKAKFKLQLNSDLGAAFDLNGELTLRIEGGGVNAEGVVVLNGGKFKFGKISGTIKAPVLDIRKAKAKLPGPGRHTFKFVAGIAGDGTTPNEPPRLRIAFGDIFATQIAPEALKAKGKNYVLGAPVGRGVKGVTLGYASERLSVRGGDAEIGDIPEGTVPLLLIVRIGDDERAVQVRAVRKGKIIKY